jgi:excisionase family DNA binding protein
MSKTATVFHVPVSAYPTTTQTITQQPSTLEPIFVTVEEAARLYRLGQTKMRELVAAGLVPSVRVGRCRRIPLAGLRRWAEEQGAA